MMRILHFLFILIGIVFATFSHAALDLELTQGIQGATPIAIVPFAGQSRDLHNARSNNIAAVITNDLAHSGQFNTIPVNQMPGRPHNAANIVFKAWQKKGVNNVVVGKVIAKGGNHYQVTFQLVNVYNARPNKTNDSSRQAWQNAVLLQKTFTAAGNQLRALAHHISDLIYQQLTGIRGIFSTKIAYILVQEHNGQRKYYLEVADADGHNPKALLTSSQPIMSPTWSPDGKQLAYVSFEGGFPAIYAQHVATGSRRKLSKVPGINGAPAWSPDGKKIALVLTKTGYPKIYVLTLRTRKLQQVTHGWSIDTEPNWSPDGKSIIFTSNRGGGPQIYQVTLATKQVQRLTYDGSYNATASFTPDGKNIIVLHRQNGLYNIAIQNLEKGRMDLLTQSGQDQSPSVAPNGKMVVYATQYGGRGVLGIVSTDGRIKLLLPAHEGIVREPVWSPFLNN